MRNLTASFSLVAILAITAAPAFSADDPGGGAVALTGCSSAQKAAEHDLENNELKCATSCATSDLNRSAGQMAADCGKQCAANAILDPQNLADVYKIFEGAQASAIRNGAKLPKADVDAGAK